MKRFVMALALVGMMACGDGGLGVGLDAGVLVDTRGTHKAFYLRATPSQPCKFVAPTGAAFATLYLFGQQVADRAIQVRDGLLSLDGACGIVSICAQAVSLAAIFDNPLPPETINEATHPAPGTCTETIVGRTLEVGVTTLTVPPSFDSVYVDGVIIPQSCWAYTYGNDNAISVQTTVFGPGEHVIGVCE